MLLYEMLYSDAPFRGNSSIEIFEKILCENEKLPFPPHVAVSSAAKDLLRRLLHKVERCHFSLFANFYIGRIQTTQQRTCH